MGRVNPVIVNRPAALGEREESTSMMHEHRPGDITHQRFGLAPMPRTPERVGNDVGNFQKAGASKSADILKWT